MKNVALISIDALTYRALGSSGHEPTPSPTLDRLIDEGLTLTNCYSPGSVTQFAFPSLLTSTFPLDYGGYDRGVLDRPTTLAEIFERHGYRTCGFASAWWQDRLFGYDRGFEDFHSLCDMTMFLDGATNVYIDYFWETYDDPTERVAVASEELVPFLSRWFDRLPEFCREKIDEREGSSIPTGPDIHAWDFEGIGDVLREERDRFHDDVDTYVESLVLQDDSFFEGLRKRHDKPPAPSIGRRTVFPTAGFATLRNRHHVRDCQISKPMDAVQALYDVSKKFWFTQPTRTPSASYVLDNALNWIDRRTKSPFFLWAHLMDIHELNWLSWEDGSERRTRENQRALELRDRMKATDSWRGNPYYDFAVRYVDAQVERFVDALRERQLLEDTVIAIVSDHGHYLSERPFRPTAKIDDFYDERYHVPAVIWNAGPRGCIDDLASSLDFAPTLLDAIDLPSPAGFDGRSVLAAGGRDLVVMENASHGPCDLERKPINVAVRTPERKLARKGGELAGYWDLERDPLEFENVIDAARGETDEQFERLAEHISERVERVRSQ